MGSDRRDGLGEVDILAFLVARNFGVTAFSSIHGIALVGIAFLAAVGVSLLGYSFDRTGSYDTGLFVIAGCIIMSGMPLGAYPGDKDIGTIAVVRG